jgi:hypothetical protein
MFDIVIPVGPNDLNVIKHNLEYKKNIIGYRNIYLISCDDSLFIEDCITIKEDIFPFTIKTLENMFGKNTRNGWYLQQLLKLYAGNIIPDILNKYLVIDADTCFLKPLHFLTDGKCIYTGGVEYHRPYFEHMSRLHPSLKKTLKLSGIAHHMLFETDMVNKLFIMIEDYHKTPFWKVFLNQVDKTHYSRSGASEYELYLTYMHLYHPQKIIIRQLRWINSNKYDLITNNQNLDFIGMHWYLRN